MMSLLRRTEKPAQYYRRPVKPGKQFGLDSIELFQIFIFTLSGIQGILAVLWPTITIKNMDDFNVRILRDIFHNKK